MTTTIPNTSTSGTAGTPSPAAVATESLDGTDVAAIADRIQIMTLAYEFRQMFGLLAQALSLSTDPGTGRLRVFLDAGTTAGGVGLGGSNSTALTVQNSSGFAATVTNISATAAGGNKPDTMIFDAMQNAWANSVLPCIGRA